MNPTLRKSRLHAATVRITHHVTAKLVAHAIIDSDRTTGETLSRKEIGKVVRYSLEFSGKDRLYFLQENIYPEDWAERMP